MQGLTNDGQQMVHAMAARHGFGSDAVLHLLHAVASGNGTQAQFNHFELGGMGQWSQGGMIMIGDMFNQSLKYRVDALCNDLSGALATAWPFVPAPTPTSNNSLYMPGSQSWRWPAELGTPSSSGSQNDLHYAVFPAMQRLAIEQFGQISVYDTGQHQIGGVSQQQGGDQSLTFTSQFGLVRLYDLPLVSGDAAQPAPYQPAPPAPATPAPQPFAAPAPASPLPATMADDEIFSRLERLADLCQKGVLTNDEFAAKKAELLARL